jgi:Fe-Mn family superoxide dismutase
MHKANDYQKLKGTPGFSDAALDLHFSLYNGYVDNTNKLLELLDNKKPGSIEYSELQRRFGWEWNGMRLHELYFGNLVNGGKKLNEGDKLLKEINRIYGSFDDWKNNFISVGKMRGIGWVVLYYDISANELFNAWINEHDAGHFAGASPLLVMDVFEHAYLPDYKTDRGAYIDAFFENINWEVAKKRVK